MEGAVIEKRKSRMWLCEHVHVPVWIFSCGEAEQGDLLGGAMQCEGGGMDGPSIARRAQQEREYWEAGATVEGQSRTGREWPSYRS